MEPVRKPFQGVINIVRFNWHYFALSAGIMLVLALVWRFLPGPLGDLAGFGLLLAAAATLLTLIVSVVVYDRSGLYTLDWLDDWQIPPEANLVNIHSGFDETSGALHHKFPSAHLTVLDFYDPARHTEISIRRARRAHPPWPGTLTVSTSALPLPDHGSDFVFLILAAHEIRDDAERALFFREAKRLLAPGGRILVTEHLRDLPNLLAYNIGAFHFHTRRTWKNTFAAAGLKIVHASTHTPFLNNFILQSDGTPA